MEQEGRSWDRSVGTRDLGVGTRDFGTSHRADPIRSQPIRARDLIPRHFIPKFITRRCAALGTLINRVKCKTNGGSRHKTLCLCHTKRFLGATKPSQLRRRGTAATVRQNQVRTSDAKSSAEYSNPTIHLNILNVALLTFYI